MGKGLGAARPGGRSPGKGPRVAPVSFLVSWSWGLVGWRANHPPSDRLPLTEKSPLRKVTGALWSSSQFQGHFSRRRGLGALGWRRRAAVPARVTCRSPCLISWAQLPEVGLGEQLVSILADLFTQLPAHLDGNTGLAPWRKWLNASLKHKMFL